MDGELLGPDVSVADVVTVGMFWILFSSESEEVSLADTSKLALDKTSKASVIIFFVTSAPNIFILLYFDL